MNITITVRRVQHIEKQEVNFDLSKNQVTCIVGKNGVGKTTLIRALRNLVINNTFQDTAAPYIFDKDSKITYSVEGIDEPIQFTFNKFIGSLDSKQNIPEDLKSIVKVELPMPHGERFSHFRRLSDIDEPLRAKIAVGDFKTPVELIRFLKLIYGTHSFDDLKQADISGVTYYFVLKDEDDRYYIREDYFSSGEYFVVNLFKQIQQGKKLIAIDEIDISLDASAQVNLVNVLREYCQKYKTNIVFTTHSLALMKTLRDNELHYMELSENQGDSCVSLIPRSYNFIKSTMYGFKGYDKYILTEDPCLSGYINHLIHSSEKAVFFKHQTIHIGGATQVIDLKNRNSIHTYFATESDVLAVLDGDQQGKDYLKGIDNVLLLPFHSIEHELYERYENGDIEFQGLEEITNKRRTAKAKNLYNQVTKKRYDKPALITEKEIYDRLEKWNPDGVATFRTELLKFLNRN